MQLKPVVKLLDYVNLRFLYLPKVLLKMFFIRKILITLLNSLNSSNFLPPNTLYTDYCHHFQAANFTALPHVWLSSSQFQMIIFPMTKVAC